ncbi:hypothetical protein NL676_035396 [Syzygium grande]|nr:hypothetical protein NL676_035396 [Syzygium grande]
MEVGYDGITYNRSMSGSRVQSRPLLHHLLSLSALLKDPILLSSSVSLHHSLLSPPFPSPPPSAGTRASPSLPRPSPRLRS